MLDYALGPLSVTLQIQTCCNCVPSTPRHLQDTSNETLALSLLEQIAASIPHHTADGSLDTGGCSLCSMQITCLSIWVAFFTGRDGYDDSDEGSAYVDIWEVVT